MSGFQNEWTYLVWAHGVTSYGERIIYYLFCETFLIILQRDEDNNKYHITRTMWIYVYIHLASSLWDFPGILQKYFCGSLEKLTMQRSMFFIYQQCVSNFFYYLERRIWMRRPVPDYYPSFCKWKLWEAYPLRRSEVNTL